MNRSLILSLLLFLSCAADANGQTRAMEVELIDRSKIHGETDVATLDLPMLLGNVTADIRHIKSIERTNDGYYVTLTNGDRITCSGLGRESIPFTSLTGQVDLKLELVNRIRFKSECKDLVLHYDFEDIEGGTVFDCSGNNLHGTIRGNAAVVKGGVAGKGLRIQKSTDFVEAIHEGLDITGWDGLTVSVWLNLDGITTYGSVLSHSPVGGQGGSPWHLSIGGLYGSKKIAGTFGASGGSLYSKMLRPKRTEYLTLKKWYHIVGTTDGTRVRYYVNGELDIEKLLEEPGELKGDPSHTLTVGKYRAHRDNWLDSYPQGIVDEVKIYSGELSPEEVRALYHEHCAVE